MIKPRSIIQHPCTISGNIISELDAALWSLRVQNLKCQETDKMSKRCSRASFQKHRPDQSVIFPFRAAPTLISPLHLKIVTSPPLTWVMTFTLPETWSWPAVQSSYTLLLSLCVSVLLCHTALLQRWFKRHPAGKTEASRLFRARWKMPAVILDFVCISFLPCVFFLLLGPRRVVFCAFEVWFIEDICMFVKPLCLIYLLL